MSPINASPVRGPISVVPETNPVEVAGDTYGALPASTETVQAIRSMVPTGGFHSIAVGAATAATWVSDVVKDIGQALNPDPRNRPVSGKAPFLVMEGGLQGACSR